MKYALVVLLFSFSVFAAVTPAQMKQIRMDTYEVMLEVADGELDPDLRSVKVIDELGSRATIQFRFFEEQFGERTCTYIYDLRTMAPMRNTVLCD